MKDLSIIIPAKQEVESLPIVLDEIKNFECDKIVILPPEDNETINAISKFNSLKIIKQNSPGVGSAIKQGISSINTNYFCILMADGSTDPKYIPQFYELLNREKLDLVFGSRYEKNDSGSDDDTIVTSFGNWLFSFLGKFLFQTKINDILFMYVMGKTEEFNNLKLQSYDHRICVELAIKAKLKKLKYKCSPSFERKRFGGTKKVSVIKDGFLILMKVLKLFIVRK